MIQIFITRHDLERLEALLDKKLRLDEYDQALKSELNRAQVVDEHDIPSDVITMNSKVRLKDEDGSLNNYTLVFPEDADLAEDKISILSPIGCSLIGFKVGSIVSFPTPKGLKQVTVDEVLYQPERAGDMDL